MVTGAQSDPGQWVGLRLAWRGLGQPHLEAGSPGWGPPSGTIPAHGFWSDAMCAYVALGLPRSSAPGLLRRLAATSGLPFPPASNGQLPSSSAAQSAVWDLQPSWWCLRKQGELCQNHRLALRAAWCRPQAGGGGPASPRSARPAPQPGLLPGASDVSADPSAQPGEEPPYRQARGCLVLLASYFMLLRSHFSLLETQKSGICGFL